MFWFPGFSVIYALIIELNFHIQNQPYYGVKNKSSIKNVYKKDGGKGTGNKKHKWQVQNRRGEIKNGIGNGEAKELICMTHGHELRGVVYWWVRGCRVEGNKRDKKMEQLQQHNQ